MHNLRIVEWAFTALAVLAFALAIAWITSDDILITRQHGLLAAIAGGVFANVAVSASRSGR